MKTAILCGGFALVCGGSVSAQGLQFPLEHSGKAPEPPLVAPVPEGAQWTIYSSRTATTTNENGETEMIPNESKASRIYHAYSPGIRRIIVEFNGQTQPPVYRTQHAIMHINARTKKVRAQNATDPTAGGRAANPGTFDELGWVSKRNYIGDTTFEGKKCNVYREYYPEVKPPTREPIPDDDPDWYLMQQMEEIDESPVVGVPVSEVKDPKKAQILHTALIDEETKLPVAFEKPGAVWIYEFSDDTELFSLPPEYMKALEEYAKTLVDIRQKYNIPQ